MEKGKSEPLEREFQQLDIILPETGHDLFLNVEFLKKSALEYEISKSLSIVTSHRKHLDMLRSKNNSTSAGLENV